MNCRGLRSEWQLLQGGKPDSRYLCLMYDCPICRPLFHVYEKVKQLQFLNPVVEVFLGESIYSRRHREFDELKHVSETLEQTGLLAQSAALMADASLIQVADIATLEKIQNQYQHLLEVLS